MSYEEFMELPLDDIHKYKELISWKGVRNIPLTEKEKEIQRHMMRYCDSIRLERCFTLKSYEK